VGIVVTVSTVGAAKTEGMARARRVAALKRVILLEDMSVGFESKNWKST
jgi:hypothetical protein